MLAISLSGCGTEPSLVRYDISSWVYTLDPQFAERESEQLVIYNMMEGLMRQRPDGKLDVGGAVGKDGMLTVSRDIGLREPYVGSTELVSGEIAEDLSAYLVESEQIPAACGLGVLIDRDRSVLTAGGYLIQLLPGAGEDVITKVEGGIYAAPSVTNLLKENSDPAVLLKTVLSDFDMEILSVDPIEYRCYCSRERTERALLSLGSKELEQIVEEQGGAELSCQFCDKVQTFTAEELQAMIADLKKNGK